MYSHTTSLQRPDIGCIGSHLPMLPMFVQPSGSSRPEECIMNPEAPGHANEHRRKLKFHKLIAQKHRQQRGLMYEPRTSALWSDKQANGKEEMGRMEIILSQRGGSTLGLLLFQPSDWFSYKSLFASQFLSPCFNSLVNDLYKMECFLVALVVFVL